jgi:hypothetical protein
MSNKDERAMVEALKKIAEEHWKQWIRREIDQLERDMNE